MTKSIKNLAYLYVVGGLVAFWASFSIMVEKMAVSADPSYVPPCSINPFISCGPVMESAQASVFGFPNPLIGIAWFAAIIAVGLAIFSGAKFKKWYWLGLQLGMTLSVAFVYWLFYEIVFDIGALCTFCMIVWAMTIPLFLYTTVYNIRQGYLSFLPKGLSSALKNWHVTVLLVLMYGVIVGTIFYKFWSNWLIMFGLV